MVGAGGISALVSALQDGSSRAKAAASRLLLGFAAEGPESQEWIAAAPGAVDGLVDLLRCAPYPDQATSTRRPPVAWLHDQCAMRLRVVGSFLSDTRANGCVPCCLQRILKVPASQLAVDYTHMQRRLPNHSPHM